MSISLKGSFHGAGATGRLTRHDPFHEEAEELVVPAKGAALLPPEVLDDAMELAGRSVSCISGGPRQAYDERLHSRHRPSEASNPLKRCERSGGSDRERRGL